MSGTLTEIDLSAMGTGAMRPAVGAGYMIGFNTSVDQGIVQGTLADRHAIPVAGSQNGSRAYLANSLGSTLMQDADAAGRYLSTGEAGSTIILTFAAPQTSLALLWGSIDTGNSISFNNQAADVLTGSTVQGLADGFVGDGFQGMGGSAYVNITTDTAFTAVALSSNLISFEATGLIASALPVTVPEPMSVALLGVGLASMGMARQRRSARVSALAMALGNDGQVTAAIR